MLSIKDSVAVITGGASGIGLSLAKYWLDKGGKVVIGDVVESALEQAAGELKGDVATVLCNVTLEEDCLKVLALFQLANPRCELRIAAGREVHLGSLQPLGLYPANSIFVGDYLTTKGQPPNEDYRMIEALGFEVVPDAS